MRRKATTDNDVNMGHGSEHIVYAGGREDREKTVRSSHTVRTIVAWDCWFSRHVLVAHLAAEAVTVPVLVADGDLYTAITRRVPEVLIEAQTLCARIRSHWWAFERAVVQAAGKCVLCPVLCAGRWREISPCHRIPATG